MLSPPLCMETLRLKAVRSLASHLVGGWQWGLRLGSTAFPLQLWGPGHFRTGAEGALVWRRESTGGFGHRYAGRGGRWWLSLVLSQKPPVS